MEYNAKILIADENPGQRQLLRDGLARAGYRFIEEASNGDEAMQKLGRFHPDVAIVDIWLSKLDGIGVLRNSAKLDYGRDKRPSFIIVSMVSNQNIFLEAMPVEALRYREPLRAHSRDTSRQTEKSHNSSCNATG